MAGGLMQLVAYGAQDVYLTGNPQITFFKVVYRRHTNFSMECIELTLNGNPDFGRRSTVCVTRNGDLITNVYVQVTLSEVTPSEGSKFAWIRRLGHALLNYVEVEIGGSRIDKQYGTWLEIWYELAHHAGDGDRGYDHMIGDVPELTAYNGERKPEYTLFIPLQFWFNRHVGLALPLIALQYHEVRLNIDFARVEDLIVANKCFKAHDMKSLSMKDAQLLVDYIYLDSEERRRFAQVGHEYLIEQLQFTGSESVQAQTGKYKLDFNHPTKELVWAVRNGNFSSGKAFLDYTHEDVWATCGTSGVLQHAAEKLLRESACLLTCDVVEEDCYCNETVIQSGQLPPEGHWECFPPGHGGSCATPTGCGAEVPKIRVCNESTDKTLWVNTSSLVIKECPGSLSYNLTGKVGGTIHVSCDNEITLSGVTHSLTVRDLSLPIEMFCDTRCESDDPLVNQLNFGVLIDGTGNPVEYGLIQLNGHDRFDRREGAYFNYVQPDQHHTNTPSDGVNVYSFSLNPEQHQPSGSANLSRIDNTQLNLWFRDPTFRKGLPPLNFLNSDNKLLIFAYSYNVLRVMSGMGGSAYSN